MKKRYKNELVNTVIGEDSHLNGEIHTQRSIRIEGTLDGTIQSQGEVFIGEKSRVKANIVAKQVTVSGEVNGNIEATNGLFISKTGRVYGDISGDRLTIEEGAIYKGKVNMDVISSINEFEGNVRIST